MDLRRSGRRHARRLLRRFVGKNKIYIEGEYGARTREKDICSSESHHHPLTVSNW